VPGITIPSPLAQDAGRPIRKESATENEGCAYARLAHPRVAASNKHDKPAQPDSRGTQRLESSRLIDATCR